jgi:ubiquinone/menaquinone biosynthesis C-methylase UbiE
MEGRVDPKQRFSGRASSYAKARPGYPHELFDHLFSVGALSKGCKVADLGSGTGIFSELLLSHGVAVYAVEPNLEMRDLAEARLSLAPGFHSVPGCAERTTLPDGSMDAATAAQAFHWFDPDLTREELRRVLRPRGQVIMVWNNRRKRQINSIEPTQNLSIDIRGIRTRSMPCARTHRTASIRPATITPSSGTARIMTWKA